MPKERVRLVRRHDVKPYEFATGAVKQPRKYGDHMEHVPPAGLNPLLIVMSSPQALVYRDAKLFGATPMLVPIDPNTESVTITLKTTGYLEKTLQVRPGPSGNLEASAVLEKDPAYQNLKPVQLEQPKKKS